MSDKNVQDYSFEDSGNVDMQAEREREERRRRRAARERKRRRRRRKLIIKSGILIALLIILAICIGALVKNIGGNKDNADNQQEVIDGEPSDDAQQEENPIADVQSQRQQILDDAAYTAAGYDYDGAIAMLQTIENYETDAEVTELIARYTAERDACVPVDVNNVPHIFYHSLINDVNRALNPAVVGESAAAGQNAWMTTIEEFDKITQAMYDNGYVFVRLRDLVVETVDENGQSHFTANTNLRLPVGKKAVVLSIDDLSYYHSYKAAGYPNKLVLDENGKVKCEYTDASGNTTVGDYDVVPRLNSFLEAHPDGAYKGARGLIAMTGYNGCFGYRTDVAYKTGEKLGWDQQEWLDEHPDFNWDNEVAEATKIADAIKESGWEFASHTWGHLSVTNKSAEALQVDNEKWVNTVQNIVGEVDTIIFAHGNDIGDWRDYSADNEKYQYYKSAGYNFFCNVDGSTYSWVQIRDNYVRQGRINLDGYMLYKASSGQTDVLNSMFNASEVFDSRRSTPVTANGKG